MAKWESLADPIVLAQQMWNHGARMREQFAQKKLAWSKLTSQELTDMLVYLQNLPETKHWRGNFQFPPSDTGEALFQSKGCAGCHTGKLALEGLLRNQTLTEIAVDMWNHQPNMKQPPPTFTPEEMRQIIGYIWAQAVFPRQRQRRARQEGLRREELRHLPQRSRERRAQAGQGQGRLFRHHHGGRRSGSTARACWSSWTRRRSPGRASPRSRCRT